MSENPDFPDPLQSDAGISPLQQRRYSSPQAMDSNNSTHTRRTSFSRRNSYSIRREKLSLDDDPLNALDETYSYPKPVDCLALSSSDELRVINSITETSQKKMTGAVFNVEVNFSTTGSLRLGVRDLHGGILVVSVLKRPDNTPGPGELSGIRMGDVILGVNFKACREGSKTLSSMLKSLTESSAGAASTVSLQMWRCQSICSEPPPGVLFPKVDDMVIRSFSLFRNKLLSDWERSNFLENILSYIQQDLEITKKVNILKSSKNDFDLMVPLMKERRAQDNLILDLERNIFLAKGLRPAVSVRIVHTKLAMGDNSNAVVYVLRVEDVESGLQWTAQWRYRDFFQLHQELTEMSYFTKEIPFPKKRLMGSSHVVEERIVALEEFIRTAVDVLTGHASTDSGASKALRHIQSFLGVGRYVDCIRPPKMDDQRCIELMTYKHLNDLSSPSCQHCKRFVLTVDLDSKVVPGPLGYKPVLEFLCAALQEVEQFTLQNHGQLMTQVLRDRRNDLEESQVKSFVRRCVRRQVEAAVYLPLRRTLLRIVYSFIAKKAEKLHKSIEYLRHLPPEYFFLDNAVSQCKSLPVAAKAFRDLVQAYLPADQGQLLIKAAITVMVVQTECMSLISSRDVKEKTGDTFPHSNSGDALSSPVAAETDPSNVKLLDYKTIEDPAGTLMCNVGVDVLKSNLGAINIDRLKKQASTGQLCDDDEDDESESLLKILEEEKRQSAGENDAKESAKKPITHTSHWHELMGTLTQPISQSNGLKSFPSAFSDGDIASASAVRSTAFNDPLCQVEKNDFPDNIVSVSINGSNQRRTSLGKQLTPSQVDTTPLNALSPSCLGKEMSKSVQNSPMPSHRDEYLTDEFTAEEQKLLGHAGYNEDAVEGARVHYAGTTATQDVLGGDFGATMSQVAEVDAMRKRSTLPSLHDRTSSHTADSSNVDASMISNSVKDSDNKTDGFYDNIDHDAVVSADDFLPMFTYVLVQAHLPQMLLVKELMNSLMDSEEAYGECGYYMATLEAATQHIIDLADQHGGGSGDQAVTPSSQQS